MKKLSVAALAVLLSLSGGDLYSIDEAKAVSILEGKASSAASSAVQSATDSTVNSAINGAISGVERVTYKNGFEQHIKVGSLEEMAKSVQYDEATNTTIFTDIEYIETSATERKNVNVGRVTLVGYKPGQVLKDGDVIEECTFEDFHVSIFKFESADVPTLSVAVHFYRLNVKSMVYNISNFTNMFTDIAETNFSQFSNLHQGLVIENLTVEDPMGMVMAIENITMPPLVSLEDVTTHINGINITDKLSDFGTMTIAKIELNSFNLPLIKKLTDIAEKDLSDDQMILEYKKIQDLPFKKKLFSDVTLEDLLWIPQDSAIKQFKNKNVTLAKLAIKFDNANTNNLVALFDLADFNMSSEFLAAIDPSIGAMLGASLPPILSVDYTTSYALNNQQQTMDMDSDLNIDSVLNLGTDVKNSYKCANIWDVLLLSPEGQNCLGLNTVSLTLKDLGVGSLAAKLAVAMTGIGAENLVSFASGSLQVMAMGAKTGVANVDAATASLTENVIKFIEKPGILKMMLNFNPPLTMKDMEKGLPENFTYDFKVEQGEKTLQELAI